MKKLDKILSIVVLVMMLCSIMTNVFATTQSNNPKDLFGQGTAAPQELTSVGGTIISIVQVICNIIAVCLLLVLGVKYMMGSTQEKAEYKKTMIPYLVGAVLLFGASFVIGSLYSFSQNLNQAK